MSVVFWIKTSYELWARILVSQFHRHPKTRFTFVILRFFFFSKPPIEMWSDGAARQFASTCGLETSVTQLPWLFSLFFFFFKLHIIVVSTFLLQQLFFCSVSLKKGLFFKCDWIVTSSHTMEDNFIYGLCWGWINKSILTAGQSAQWTTHRITHRKSI